MTKTTTRAFTCRAVAVYMAIAVCACCITRSDAQGGGEAPERGPDSGKAVPIFGLKIPSGYRDWRLVSVAHEAGSLNDIRAILGNDPAIRAYREGKESFPDGAIIVRLSWNYVPSEQNDKVFAAHSPLSPDPSRIGTCNSWSRMQKSSRRRAAGDTRSSIRMAILPMRRRCRHAIPATPP